MIGGFGRAEVFSFHATKFFNTFEGGAITTNDDALAAKLRLMTNFGFSGYDNVVHVGTNGKMNEVSAAMGLTSLAAIDGFIETNRVHHAHYMRRLSALPGIRLLPYDESERSNRQYVVVEYTPSPGGPTRDMLIDLLWAENVMARRYFHPGCHRMEPYRTLFPEAASHLANTETITDRLVILPTGTGVSEDDVACICDIVSLALARGSEVVERLSRADAKAQ
jgi:dTDP-4-amino-4,6-dideoxygalactose transaminase